MGDSEKKEVAVRKTSWMDGLKAEFRKIAWLSREKVIRQTTAVVAVTIVLSLIIALFDTFIKYGIDFLVGL